jgi:hypothetical protein
VSTAVSSGRQAAGKRQSSLALSAAKTELLKRAAIALSIANLCFLFVWSEILLIASERRFAYFLQRPPDRPMLWAVVIDVAVLGAVVFGLLFLRKSSAWQLRMFAKFALGAITVFAVYQLQRSANGWLYGVVSARSILILRIAAAAAIVFMIIRSPKRALPGLRAFLLILSPLFFVLAAQGLWLYYGADSQHFAPGQPAGMLPASASHNRVVWIVFDELDGRLLFEVRPSRIQLPHFDALRKLSIFGDRVESPAPNTLSAIPSLLLSKIIPRDEDVNLNSRPIQVRFSGCSQFASIHSQQNIFRRVRAIGLNTAAAGWYHPYCRVFGDDLSACATENGLMDAAGIQEFLRQQPLWRKAVYVADWESRALPLMDRLYWIHSVPEQSLLNRQLHIARLHSLLLQAAQLLKNPNLDFVFLHLPVPHPPGIWDTKTQTFTTDDHADYIDNLALADKVLGQIRRTLEQTGDWDRSTILVSADHPYRALHWLTAREVAAPPEMVRLTRMRWQPYIPFFLKLPGQKTGLAYHREFNSVLSADLLLEALQGHIRTPGQAVQWLDAHAAASEQKVCR